MASPPKHSFLSLANVTGFPLCCQDVLLFNLFLEFALATNHCESMYFSLLLCFLSRLRDREHGATRNNPCCISAKCLCWVVFKLSLSRSYPNPIKRESPWLQKLPRWSEFQWGWKKEYGLWRADNLDSNASFATYEAWLWAILNLPKLHLFQRVHSTMCQTVSGVK